MDGAMSQRSSGYARQPNEAYNTPAWIAEIMFFHLRKKALTIWEPAAGDTGLAQALERYGFRVVATKDDFFSYTSMPSDDIDAIVTNPPYGIDRKGKLASDFIRHALSFDMVRVIAMLLPIDYDSAKSRTDMFRDCRRWAEKIVLLDRIKWFDGPSSPSVNHAIYLWDRKHRGPPRISYGRRMDSGAPPPAHLDDDAPGQAGGLPRL